MRYEVKVFISDKDVRTYEITANSPAEAKKKAEGKAPISGCKKTAKKI